ncbi:TerD family protein [Nocardia sp. IFM 10818]
MVDLEALPPHCRRIVCAAALAGDAATFGDLGPIELQANPGTEGGAMATSTLDAATRERTLLLAELYLRNDAWRLRPVGQGYTTGLAALAQNYGVDIED